MFVWQFVLLPATQSVDSRTHAGFFCEIYLLGVFIGLQKNEQIRFTVKMVIRRPRLVKGIDRCNFSRQRRPVFKHGKGKGNRRQAIALFSLYERGS